MRKIREVLRLKFDADLSVRKIAKSLSIGHSSAGDYLCRFAASGLQWPIDLSDAELNRRLFPLAVPAPSDQRPTPDWAHVHAELRRPGVTLSVIMISCCAPDLRQSSTKMLLRKQSPAD